MTDLHFLFCIFYLKAYSSWHIYKSHNQKRDSNCNLLKRNTLLKCISFFQNNIHVKSKDFPGCSDGKEFACNVGDLSSIPWSGRYPGEGNGNPLQCLAWRIPGTEEPGGLQSLGSQELDRTR